MELNHEFIRKIILPKGRSFDDLAQSDISLMMSHINSYSIEKLNNKSPFDMFGFIYGYDVLEKLGICRIPANEILLKPSLFPFFYLIYGITNCYSVLFTLSKVAFTLTAHLNDSLKGLFQYILFGTSLGICAKSGREAKNGYRNHMRAINQVMKYISIKKTVDAGVLRSGIMYEYVKSNVPFVLAGSLRDDGSLPDTITDMIEAQNAYNEQLKKADIVLVLGTMLHGIASGNMLPAKIGMICVDISSDVVTKLSDRGSGQAVGIITDVGLFLNLLANEINKLSNISCYGEQANAL